MNDKNINNIALELQKLHKENNTAAILFDNLANRKNGQSASKVDRLQDLLSSEGPISRQQLIAVLRQLDKLGVGRFVVGRKTHPSRMEWNMNVVELGRLAQGATTDKPSESNVSNTVPEVIPMSDLTVSYPLRPTLKITLSLPLDLTVREADRLADFIRTLPFENGHS